MKEKVYIETSFVSYLTAKTSSDIHQLSRQIESQQWWDNDREQFDLFTSDVVVREASKGDAEAAAKRRTILSLLTALEITPDAIALSRDLIEQQLLPAAASEDALHIAISATHGMDFLLTWNCKHLANAVICRKVYQHLSIHGYQPPVICTPAELMEQ